MTLSLTCYRCDPSSRREGCRGGCAAALCVLIGLIAPACAQPVQSQAVESGARTPAIVPESKEPRGGTTLQSSFRLSNLHLSQAKGMPHGGMRAAVQDGDKLWVGTDDGLCLVRKNSKKISCWPLPTRDIEPSPRISDMVVDRSTGDLWIGTWGHGLMRFSAGRFDRFDQMDSGLAGNLVHAIVLRGHEIIAATNGGVSHFVPGREVWKTYLPRTARHEQAPVDVALDGSGRWLYVAMWCDGLRVIDLQSSMEERIDYAHPSGVKHRSSSGKESSKRENHDTTFAVDVIDDVVWWGMQDRLIRFPAGRTGAALLDEPWQIVSLRGTTENLATSLAAGTKDVAVVGTRYGMLMVTTNEDEPRLVWFPEEVPRLPNLGVEKSIAEKGLRALAASGIPTYSTPFAAGSSKPVLDIRHLRTSGGNLWMTTPGEVLAWLHEGDSRGTAKAWAQCTPKEELPHGVGPDRSVSRSPHAPATRPPGKSIPIGALTPITRVMHLPGQTKATVEATRQLDVPAFQLAIFEANRKGGWRGQRRYSIALDPYGYARYGWNLPEDDFATLALKSKVVAALAYLPAGSRFSTAAAWRTQLPIFNAAAGEASIDERMAGCITRPPRSAADDVDRESFSERYRKRFHRAPTAVAYDAYVATNWLLSALESREAADSSARSPAGARP